MLYAKNMEKDMSREYEETDPKLDSQSKLDLDTITETLGFIETPDLILIRQAIVEAQTIRKDTEAAQALLAEYQTMGEAVVESAEYYSNAQIGLIITTAAIRRDIGNIGAAINDLQDALIYARNMGHDELAPELRNAITELENEYNSELQPGKEIAESLAPYDDYGLDPETRTEIAAMPFDEAFETAYGYLMQAGINADEALAQFIEQLE